METLDKCFENVCELDLIFHMDKVSVVWGGWGGGHICKCFFCSLLLLCPGVELRSIQVAYLLNSAPFPVSEQPTQLFPTCGTTALAYDVILLSIK